MQQKRVWTLADTSACVCAVCIYFEVYMHIYTAQWQKHDVWEHSNNYDSSCAQPMYVCTYFYKNIVCVPEYNMCLHVGACASVCAGILGVGT